MTHSFRFAKRCRALVVALLSIATMSACSESSTPTSPRVNTVQVTTSTTTVRAGATLTLGLKVLDADGNAVENVAVYWSSSDASVATVSNSGVVTATAVGVVKIAATALGKSATTTLTVTGREVATVQVSPPVTTVRIGTTTPLTATVLDADGNALVRTVGWSTSDPSIATVSSSGVVTGVGAGSATVTATSENRTATAAITVTLSAVATVTVTPVRDTIGVGSQATLSVTLKDAAGATLTGRNVTWSSTAPQIATVSSTGIVTALSPGTATISASSEGRSATAVVVVLARLASTVTLTPNNQTLVAGTTQQLVAQITDPAGNVLNDRPISFASSNNLVALVSTTGLVTAVSPGSVTITATSEGKVGLATVVVTALPVATVTVTPATANLFVGNTTQLNAQALSTGGAVLAGRTVTWISGAPGIASVSAAGLVTALAPGTAVVVAVVDGVSAQAVITVRIRPVATVTVSPPTPAIIVGASTQLSAATRDDSGNLLTGRAIIWSSADESVAFVSSTGLLVAVKAGTTTISATSEGVIGSTVVTVR